MTNNEKNRVSEILLGVINYIACRGGQEEADQFARALVATYPDIVEALVAESPAPKQKPKIGFAFSGNGGGGIN